MKLDAFRVIGNPWKREKVGRRWRTAAIVMGVWMLALMWGVQPTAAMSTASGATTVTFNIAEAIEVTTWPTSNLALEAVNPGEPVVSEGLPFKVFSNTTWGLQISSDSDDGYMYEYDIYSNEITENGLSIGPVEWSTSVGGPWTALSSEPEAIVTDQPPTGDDGENVVLLLRVTPSFNDQPLPNGREYRIVLVYTAGVGF